jgi:putative ABC transport system permease protein
MNATVKPVRLSAPDLLRLGLLRARTRPMRAALSALGISIGVATMIVVVGIPASSHEALTRQLSALGTNLLRAEFPPDQITKQPVPVAAEAPAMAARIGPVEKTSAVANTHTEVRRSDVAPPGDTSGVSVLAARANLLDVLSGSVRSGRFLTPVTERYPGVVLGGQAARWLGIGDLDAGRPAPQLWIGQRWYTVVGILNPLPLAPDVERSVLVGWESARDQLRFDGHPTVVYVRSTESSIEDVRAVLPATLYPPQPGAAQVSRPSDALAAKRLTDSAFSALFLGLAAVALLVGGIGVANTMVISVLERRREIGLRRALGANRGQIRGQFLTESVALCGLGGAAGALLGVLGTAGYATYEGWPVVIPLSAIGGGLASALLVGALAGMYPAVRASRLTPTEALASA